MGMSDREKRIKGLKTIKQFFGYGLPSTAEMFDSYYDTLNDAIALLKEQEPKAIEYHDNPYTGLPVAHCPNCKMYARQFHSSVEEETHYCPWCGQAVKWNDKTDL